MHEILTINAFRCLMGYEERNFHVQLVPVALQSMHRWVADMKGTPKVSQQRIDSLRFE